MALKFSCNACKAEIVTKYLRVGELAKCKSCGADNQVPESAAVIDDSVVTTSMKGMEAAPQVHLAEQGTERTLSCEGRRAWNPLGILWLGFFFSVLPAGILWTLNFERLGQPSRKQSSFITTGLYTLFVVLMCILPKLNFVATYINIAMCLHYFHSQKVLYRDFLSGGGQKESFGRPIVLSAAFLVLVSAGIFAYAYLDSVRYAKLYDEATASINKGNLIEAKLRLQKLENKYPDEPAPYYSLAWIHLQNLQYDSALTKYRHYLKLQPGDTLVMGHVRVLEDLLKHDSQTGSIQ